MVLWVPSVLLTERNYMDKKLQDLHICNYKTYETKIIREITIKQIKFTTENIIIEYNTKDAKMTMELPKINVSITID